jgi:quinol monooxygenase YgiN
MYVSLSIMQPNAGHVADTVESMKGFAATARSQKGLVLCSTFQDAESSRLFGIAVWESEDAARAAGPALMATVENDDFETWGAEMENYRLVEA